MYCNIVRLQNYYYNIHSEVKTQKPLNTLSIFPLQSQRFIAIKFVTKLF